MNPKCGILSHFTGTLQGLLTYYTVKNLGLLHCPKKVLGAFRTYQDFCGTFSCLPKIPEKFHQEMKSQISPTEGYTFAILHFKD